MRGYARRILMINRYFIGCLSLKIKTCDPTWTWKTIFEIGTRSVERAG